MHPDKFVRTPLGLVEILIKKINTIVKPLVPSESKTFKYRLEQNLCKFDGSPCFTYRYTIYRSAEDAVGFLSSAESEH